MDAVSQNYIHPFCWLIQFCPPGVLAKARHEVPHGATHPVRRVPFSQYASHPLLAIRKSNLPSPNWVPAKLGAWHHFFGCRQMLTFSQSPRRPKNSQPREHRQTKQRLIGRLLFACTFYDLFPNASNDWLPRVKMVPGTTFRARHHIPCDCWAS